MSFKKLHELPNFIRKPPEKGAGRSPVGNGSELDISFRHPVANDGRAMWSLVRDGGGLDLNSPYAYLMACLNWSATCVLAEDRDGLAGLIVGYRQVLRPDALFVWQIGVAPRYRGLGLGTRMLAWLVGRDGPAFVETTITPSNSASRALFAGFARRMGAGLRKTPWLNAGDFPGQHEGEDLFTIGPFDKTEE